MDSFLAFSEKFLLDLNYGDLGSQTMQKPDLGFMSPLERRTAMLALGVISLKSKCRFFLKDRLLRSEWRARMNGLLFTNRFLSSLH